MGSGYYAAFSGLLARTEALDSAASNLSNSGTKGFRAEREYFRSAIMGPDALNSQLNRSVNDFGVIGGNQIELGEGPLAPTGNPLDLAIQGQGFFAVQTKFGVRYTRDGQFQTAVDGSLITMQGEPVLNAKLQPIRIPTGEVTISSEGVISTSGTVVGNLGLFTFQSAQSIVPEGTNRYVPVNGAAPIPAAASIRQGALEGSNQDVIQGTLQLILVQRQAEMMQKALTLFNSDFDKTASEELPKV
ncbi:MAG TPA: flagellar hook basal-body protein [Silvibacterium sp.]|nr:flagellar hook basal-body protein [Silvibacterium sp.]